MDTRPISEFFDREACCHGDGEGDADLGPVSRSLLSELSSVDLRGRSVLEAGSGLGGLTLALLDRGAARATGIDLSADSVRTATDRARAAGAATRVSFVAGDAATAEVDPHDVVVLDKVFCCYPDVEGLLARTTSAAREAYAVSLPESRGVRGRAAQVAVWFENAWRRVRRDAFRAYVHDVGRMERTLEAQGFTPLGMRHRRLIWYVGVFEKHREAGGG